MKRLAGLTILIADDNALTLEALKRLLKMSGAAVSAVANGEEVIVCLQSSPKKFDVILLDINMPTMDGLTTTKKIRLDQRFDNLPIIAATADCQPEDQLKCYEVGMNAHLAKPISLHKLCEGVLAVLQKHPSNQSVESLKDSSAVTDSELRQQVLDRFGQNHEVVENLIPLYAQEFLEQLNILKHTRDSKTIISSLHILKGLAGTIGANDVYNYVVNFHASAKKNQLNEQQIIEMLETLSRLHAFNLQRLQQLFIKTEMPKNTEPHSNPKITQESRQKIIHLLEESDLSIIRYVNNLIKQFPNDNELATLNKYVEQLKFKAALEFILGQS
ncbi:MAG: response regulator [Aliiglaciecola sp.]|uniref:response regulator n=1 Tax=Aliiglaciecola sp. TaxID=1872441 RepID=UPI003298018A